MLVDFYLSAMRTALNGPCTHPSFTISTTRGPATDTWKMVLTDPRGGREVNFIALAKVGYGRAATIVINATNGRTDAQMFGALSSLKQAAASRGE